MRLLKLPEGARFTNRQLIVFIIPVLIEQLMVAGLTMADTFMVSFLGETAVAGVALVSRIDNFAKQFFVAMAQGGSVVLSQYIGACEPKNAQSALKNNIRILVLFGAVIMLAMIGFKDGVLSLLFGGAEKDVLSYSSKYFTITAYSYPFIALYYACTNTFRAMGESRIPFASSIAMMVINLLLKYVCIFKMNMGVVGAALSTLLAMAIVGFVLLVMLKSHKNKVSLNGLLKFDFDRDMSSRILKISVPNGIEQGMFQLGALLIAGLVSGLGQASIAADSIARTISPLLHCVGSAMNAAMMMVIGQCMGAKMVDEAKMYVKHILKLDYLGTLIAGIVVVTFLWPLISIFKKGASLEAQQLTYSILMVYTIGSCLLYPMSFALPSALRATGDTKFVMVVASLSMFLFRIGAAYIFVHVLHMGVVGTWVAMVSDWVIRSAVFIYRYKNEKWKKHKVI